MRFSVLAVAGVFLLSACGERGELATSMKAQASVLEPATVAKSVKPWKVFSVQKIEALFSEQDYHWPPESSVPSILLDAFPQGMETLGLAEKKAMFFRVLLPIVLSENARIEAQRVFLLELQAKGEKPSLTSAQRQRLKGLMHEYKLEGDWMDAKVQRLLLSRVDTIPVALVLAQAANESAWGTSRFTHVANNIFGHWTFDEENGVKPLRRDEGDKHFIRIFDNVSASVRAYLNNLNVGRAYSGLRRMRAGMRQKGEALDPSVLAGGLLRYSQRGKAYIKDIRAMIRSNRLDRLASRSLVLVKPR